MTLVQLTDSVPVRKSLEEVLAGSPFVSYTYSYPHKTAYRPFETPYSLQQLWAGEDQSALFLYVHVPFCEMRCGFCNLFAQTRPREELAVRYVDQLGIQAGYLRAALDNARFSRVAFGGGTPTLLPAQELERLFDIAERNFHVRLSDVPVSLETAPETASMDRLELAEARGIDRISIGVQSFVDMELKALGRPQTARQAMAALDRIRKHRFSSLNIDLIYGGDGQTPESWIESVKTALRWYPEELYLYPLYVRPLTGLGRRDRAWQDHRVRLYEDARDLLVQEGYEQVSLRMFKKVDAGSAQGPVYCCQEDGMVGLGCGARSYTRAVHYSDEWAVSASGVKGIIRHWVERQPETFDRAWYGFELDIEDQKRRYVIQSVSNAEGLNLEAYRDLYQVDARDDFSALAELESYGLLVTQADRLKPTSKGLLWVDAVGPWLYSDRVIERIGGYELR